MGMSHIDLSDAEMPSPPDRAVSADRYLRALAYGPIPRGHRPPIEEVRFWRARALARALVRELQP